VNEPIAALTGAAVATGVLHTLIPGHWLPFVMIGRARGWSAGRTAGLSSLAAVVHVGGSGLLGFLAVRVGMVWAERFGENLLRIGGWLLIVFGLGYAAWSWHNRGHFHPGGRLLHREGDVGCDGSEGDERSGHLHYHADEGLIREGRWSGPALALIVGVNPCVVLLPTLFAAAPYGGRSMGFVLAAYAAPTALLMVGLSVAGVAGTRRLSLPGAARHMEAASGIVIAALGVYLLLGH
jgi:hypothetical protein